MVDLVGFEAFGVNTRDLHYKKSVIRSVKELADEDGEPIAGCKYDYEDDMLYGEGIAVGDLACHETCANDTLVGIAPNYPFKTMHHGKDSWRVYESEDEAAEHIGEILAPLVKESAKEIAKKCRYVHCVYEC